MDKDHLKDNSPTGRHKRKFHKDVDTEVPQPSARRSARLQSKIKSSSGSKDVFKSSENDNKDVPSANIVSVTSSSAVPSFIYHAKVDDGMQLVVDLNLTTSDWLKNRAKEVFVCPNHPKPDFDSFRKEVESLRVRNSQKIISPDITAAKDASMDSYVQKEGITISSSKEVFVCPNHPKPDFDSFRKEVESLRVRNSQKIISPDITAAKDASMNSYVQKEVITVSGSKSSGSKVDQKSELIDVDSQNTKMPEVQFSDIISYPNDSLTSTTKVNQEAGGDHRRAVAENKEKNNSSEETALSREENALMMTPASDKGSKRKKPSHNSDNIHSQSRERILRSTKLLGAQIVEQDGVVTRRSSRLNSK